MIYNRTLFYAGICAGAALCFVNPSNRLLAQVPTCSGTGSNMLYSLKTPSKIYSFDPTMPTGMTNPKLNTIALPPNSAGLTVSANLNSGSPAVTFYTVTGSTYHYYNGSTWVNTNHTAGSPNIGAGGGFIYGINGTTAQVWRYDGTGNAVLLSNTITDLNNCTNYDITADCEGNFYVMKTHMTSPWLRKYDKNGVMLQSWNITGPSLTCGGGGIAIIKDTVYFNDGYTTNVYKGVFSGNNLVCTSSSTDPDIIITEDLAACDPASATPSVTVTANPAGPVGPWTLVSFTATPVNGGTSPVYQWKKNGQIIAGANSNVWSSYSLTVSDTITVELTSNMACANPKVASSNKVAANISTVIASAHNEHAIAISPNPNGGIFSVNGTIHTTEPVLLQVQNMVGQVLYSSQVYPVNGQVNEHLDFKGQWPAGQYVLKMSAGSEQYIHRFSVND